MKDVIPADNDVDDNDDGDDEDDDAYTSDNSFKNESKSNATNKVDGKADGKKRIKGERDHNAELIYDKDASINQKTFIPPLMALNVQVNTNGVSSNSNATDINNLHRSSVQDQDFRVINGGDRDERDVWQTNLAINSNSNGSNSNSNSIMQGGQPSPWAATNNNVGPVGSSSSSGGGGIPINTNTNMPPSLFDINIEPPDMSPPRVDNYRNNGNNNRDEKRRRRDSEGRRISRFDNNDRTRGRNDINQSSRSGGNRNSNNNRNRRRI